MPNPLRKAPTKIRHTPISHGPRAPTPLAQKKRRGRRKWRRKDLFDDGFRYAIAIHCTELWRIGNRKGITAILDKYKLTRHDLRNWRKKFGIKCTKQAKTAHGPKSKFQGKTFLQWEKEKAWLLKELREFEEDEAK